MTNQIDHSDYASDPKFIEHMKKVARDIEKWPKAKLAMAENSISGTAYFVEIRDRRMK